MTNRRQNHPNIPTRIVEIGCYAGETTSIFSMIADEVIAIDPWVNGYDDDDLCSTAFPMKDVEESFNARTVHLGNVTKLKTTSEKVSLNDFPIDAVYIDAVHKLKPVRDDILRWKNRITQGGYICGHDFTGYWGEVVDAVLETIGLPDVRFKDGSWAKQII